MATLPDANSLLVSRLPQNPASSPTAYRQTSPPAFPLLDHRQPLLLRGPNLSQLPASSQTLLACSLSSASLGPTRFSLHSPSSWAPGDSDLAG